jgi:hypothetical protein
VASILAPFLSRSATVSVSPFSLANIRAVTPSYRVWKGSEIRRACVVVYREDDEEKHKEETKR